MAKDKEKLLAEVKQEILEERRLRQERARQIRLANLAKGREKAALAKLERQKKQEAQIHEKALKLTKDIETIVDKYMLKHTAQAIKATFFQAFDLSGGKRAFVQWIKANPKHRQEYYKMLTTLLRQADEDEKNNQATKIVVNILGLDNQRQEIIVSDITKPPTTKQESEELLYVENK